MNWVGGARSRVKQQSDKKLQRDYFERKRLVNKVQRLRPSLSRLKKNTISQDLLFLKTAVHNAKSNTERASPARPPKHVLLDSTKRPTTSNRDLELPMSPIGQPSALELMDVSTFSTTTHDLSFYPPPSVKEQPKVSTLKVPHNTFVESQDHTVLQVHEKSMLNDLCMTESLFPMAGKRALAAAPVDPPPHKKQKIYSIDDFLNAPVHTVESMLPQKSKRHSKSSNRREQKCYDEDIIVPSHKKIKSNAKDAKSSKDPLNTTVFNESIFGPIREQHHKKTNECAGISDPTSKYRGNSAHDKSTFHSKALYSFAPWGARQNETKSKKFDMVSDNDAMLEFHYTQCEMKDKGGMRHSKPSTAHHQRVPCGKPSNPDNQSMDLNQGAVVPKPYTNLTLFTGDVDSPTDTTLNRKRDTDRRQLCVPHDTTTYSSVLTEDPLSKRNMRRKDQKTQHPRVSPVTTSVEHMKCTEDSLNTTVFNESIFGPIREQHHKKTKATFSTTKLSIPKDSENSKGSSSFERMILSMEDSKMKRERKIEHLEFGKSSLGPECSKKTWKLGDQSKRSKVTVSKPVNQQHSIWKNFVSGKQKHPATVSDVGVSTTHHEKMKKSHRPAKKPDNKPAEKPTLSEESTVAPFKPKSSLRQIGNISVFEELMCLEENIVLEDDDIPLTPAEWSEEYILTLDQLGVNHHKTLPFDDTVQDSSNTIASSEDTTTMNASEGSRRLDENVHDKPEIEKSERLLLETDKGNQNTLQPSSLSATENIPENIENSLELSETPKQSTLGLQTDSTQLNDVNAVNSDLLPNFDHNKQLEKDTQSGSVEDLIHTTTVVEIGVQTSPSNAAMLSTTDTNQKSSTIDAGIQVQPLELESSTALSSPVSTTSKHCGITEETLTVDAGIQVALESTTQLKQLNAELRKELEIAQNTIVWQSIMLKLYQ